ncbi:protein JINGUBANG-like [Silene latifolia]|uniref:protein JINGUBANG-like n=1 Tax=Silene latifolia TaxID=37657 RepID=UPI003D787AE9
MHRSLSDSKTLSTFLYEETPDRSPTFHRVSHHQLPRRSLDTVLSRNSWSNKTVLSPKSSPLLTPSPKSSWSFSPPCTPSCSPLIHHCISSLHRDGNIHSVVVSKGLVLTGSSSACIRAWRPLTSCEWGFIQASSGEVRAMLAHGDLVFTSHKDRRIRVWNIESCTTKFSPSKVTTLPKPSPLKFLTSKCRGSPHKDIISCMAYNHVDGILYTGSWDKTVKAWRLSDRRCTDSFLAHGDNINDMVVNRDGNLFTCSSDGLVKMWSQVRGETFHTLTMTLSFLPFPTYALALHEAPESRESLLYSGSSDGCLNLWERKLSGGYSHVGSIHAHRFAVLCLTILNDMVISGSADSTIKIWKRGHGKTHQCLAVLDGHRGPVKCLSACIETGVGEKGFLVFSASLDHTFKVWRVKVFPEQKETQLFICDSDSMNDGKIVWEESPVLSPTWVKKVQLGRLSVSN